MKLLVSVLAVLATILPSAAQELKLPAPSPTQTLSQDVSTSKIEIVYSRPSKKGRVIFGDVVPFNEVWRTGANAATKITFGEDVSIGGKEIKAGAYSLYSNPGKTQWEIIINKNTGNWGTNGYATSDDVARVTVPVISLPKSVETFTISIGDITFSSCTIDIMWENTMVSIPVTIANKQRLSENITKALSNPQLPYSQAAGYYLDTDQHLDKALEYANKAIEQNPKGFWLYTLKARIAAKLGNKLVAQEAAKKSMEMVKGTPYEAEYTRNNQKVLDSLK
jgi:hypothetical protein